MTAAGIADVAGMVLLVLGSTLTLVAAIAVLRFRDLFSRMHAATKPQVLGLTLMMAGLALTVRNPVVGWTLVLVVAFQLITAPISAHMVGRAGYRTGKVDSAALVVDELTQDLEASENLSDEEVERRIAVLDRDLARSGDGRAGDGRAGDGRSGDGRSGDGRAGDGRVDGATGPGRG
ncbi:monovalent cation/H(+) antiporter subunit G [Georgenia sp. EYE_87]|uniref:monovalent cation/H(+) antiporter subunit G n=1 Tax=Georgenia sp. EYE_87 TaxID=2853448 RepID=UPI0027E23988|nr:monovalent cation/H(+) antiporter subunit G [Georgenia sp. EYE_87]MCK6211316.1 monovalent cation/H(+) antiporter subunit G [Georgenia sp. EYE_87]